MKKLLLSTALSLGLCAPVFAQVNSVPAVGVNVATVRQNTYSAPILKLVPASSSTDVFCINGSATKNVRVIHWEMYATGTGISVPVYLNHNTGLDTGTAAVAATYGPVAVPLVQSNPTATAGLVAYNSTGGVPTIGGTVTTVRSTVLQVALATTPVTAQPIMYDFGTAQGLYNQQLTLLAGATTEQYCLNLNATSPGGTLNGYIEWTED